MLEEFLEGFFGERFTDLSRANGVFIYMDGFRLDNDENAKKALIKKLKRPKQNLRKSLRDKWGKLKDLHEIGIMYSDGELKWIKWFDLSGYLGADFCRLLAKGYNYRMYYERRMHHGDTIVSNRQKKIDDAQIAIEEAHNMMYLSSDHEDDHENKFQWKNTFKNVGVVHKWLKEKNILIRKEDKGDRIVLCGIWWEKCQLNQLISEFEISIIEKDHLFDLKPLYIFPKLYFSPKTHKQEPIPGRAVVSWHNSYLPNEKHIKSYIENYLKEKSDAVYTNTLSLITHVAVSEEEREIGYENLVGDIKDMFLSIPRKSLLSLVSKEIPDIANVLEEYLNHSYFSFSGVVYRFDEGLCIGSRLSPIIAKLWLVDRIKTLQHQLQRFDCRFGFYVDDFVCRYLREDNESKGNLKSMVERAIHPLKMKWSDDLKTLGVDFSGKAVGMKVRVETLNTRRLTPYEALFEDIKSQRWQRMRHIISAEDAFASVDKDLDPTNHRPSWRDHSNRQSIRVRTPEVNSDLEVYNNAIMNYIGVSHSIDNYNNCGTCVMITSLDTPKAKPIEDENADFIRLEWKPKFNQKGFPEAYAEVKKSYRSREKPVILSVAKPRTLLANIAKNKGRAYFVSRAGKAVNVEEAPKRPKYYINPEAFED
jgi:hypothetical protein